MNVTNGVQTPTDEGRGREAGRGFTLLVGTFRSPQLYTLQFQPPIKAAGGSQTKITGGVGAGAGTVSVSRKSPAVGGHSWLALSPDHTRLYATCWADPPSVASYSIDPITKTPQLLNTRPVASLSGYVVVTPSGRYLISVGGPSGEVFRLDPADGSIGDLVQPLLFRTEAELDDGRRDGVAHGSFGGLRWGAHSVDIGPGGRSVYVADIGHNCIWTYALDDSEEDVARRDGGPDSSHGPLRPGTKHIATRAHDGPRHCWPHPGGRVVYCLQEHSSMVDAFAVAEDGVTLRFLSGETILPAGKAAEDFWADEVRTSNRFSVAGDGEWRPRYLFASTRGLDVKTKGYVAAYELDASGAILGPALDIYETRTSGGLANAVEPAPAALYETLGAEAAEEEYVALTDSAEGWVVVLGWDGTRFREVSAVQLKEADGAVVGAATAVWL